MDYTLLDDAFPAIPPAASPAAGEKDRKKSKRARNIDIKTIEMPPPPSISAPEAYDTPDRKAYKKRDIPVAMKSADEGTFSDNMAAFEAPVAVAAAAAAKETFTDANWFGADEEDDMGFMPYTGSSINEAEYMLQPDFTKTFIKSGNAGLERAGGIPLKAVTMAEQWTGGFANRGSVAPMASAGEDDLKRQLRDILKRLDGIEERAVAVTGSENSNMEVLMFTMSGIFVMFLMDLVAKR